VDITKRSLPVPSEVRRRETEDLRTQRLSPGNPESSRRREDAAPGNSPQALPEAPVDRCANRELLAPAAPVLLAEAPNTPGERSPPLRKREDAEPGAAGKTKWRSHPKREFALQEGHPSGADGRHTPCAPTRPTPPTSDTRRH